MNKSPKITAILPNYNYAAYLPRRLASILNQTLPISVLIILDDCSTDNSREVLDAELAKIRAKHPEIAIKTAYNRKNSGGVIHQWKKGITLATGDFIWIAEADDLAEPTFLETLIAPMETDPEILISYADSKLVDPNGRLVPARTLRRTIEKFKHPAWFRPYVHAGVDELKSVAAIYNPIPNVSCAVFRRRPDLPDLLTAAAAYKLAGDWYFYVELMRRGRVAYTPQKLNLFCLHKDSVTKTTKQATYLAELQSIQAHVADLVPLPPKTRAAMSRQVNYLKSKWNL